ncbi:hypothetical protein Y032_0183g957 [Ancylostoma ceylanicum]|uniref:ShKT domain-containing protein n=1 Tax=Ancylostoma ceylanicum TaxID=53326 RepID=A0A016SRP0_9BILA|nr:hypothetical protein Y032_0183g957 [Ancylostoma ceylanicum]
MPSRKRSPRPGKGHTTAVPSTQSNTAAADCVDLVHPKTGVSDCPKLRYLCDDQQYYELMTEQCPKTCNRCGDAD